VAAVVSAMRGSQYYHGQDDDQDDIEAVRESVKEAESLDEEV